MAQDPKGVADMVEKESDGTYTVMATYGNSGADGQPVDGTGDGVFTLTMEEFNRLFRDVSYSNSPFAREE